MGLLKNELFQAISTYVEKEYGEPKRISGWSSLYTYLSWYLHPDGRAHGQRPGTRLVPLGANRGYEMYIELPNFIFFTMLPRVTCKDLTSHQDKHVTIMSREYEAYRQLVIPDTICQQYPHEGYFGWMVFEGHPHFFAIQVPDLARWNRFYPTEQLDDLYPNCFSRTMDPETLSITMHREICKQFTFMRPGTIGKPRDIQVLFPLTPQTIQKSKFPSI